MTTLAASIQLAAYFPPFRGLKGASTNMVDLAAYYRRGYCFPSKFAAVRLLIQRNMEATESRGYGNRAKRRWGLTWLPAQNRPQRVEDGPPTTDQREELDRLQAHHDRRRIASPHEL